MFRHRRTMICREGWYYLAVLALLFGGAMLRQVNLPVLLAGMLAAPVWFSWRLVFASLGGLQVRRKVPQSVCAGDLLVANVSLVNTRRHLGSWAVVVEEQIQHETARGCGEALRPSMLFMYVPAQQSRKGVYHGRLIRRGRYRLGPLQVSTRFPFGLFRRTITLGQTDTVFVFPRLGRLEREWVARRHEAFAGTHSRRRRHGPIEGDFYGLREWRRGDTRRWIHWRASARHGKLVVRQFEQPRSHDLALLLELWQPPQPAPEDLENVELAVSFAATVVADLCRAGGSELLVGVAGLGSACLRGPAAAALLQETMETLAVAEADSEDRLPELVGRALQQVDPGTEIVLVSTRKVDLFDTVRFGALWSDPARRSLVRSIRCIDTSSDQLAAYFQPQ